MTRRSSGLNSYSSYPKGQTSGDRIQPEATPELKDCLIKLEVVVMVLYVEN